MSLLWDIVLFGVQSFVIFVVSTLIFDALHYMLHRWKTSRFRILRVFSSWHWVHHKFLNLDMKIDPRYRWKNIWFHILPEYGTSMAGTLIFFFVFPWPPVVFIAVIRTIMLGMTLKEEGMDFNHMSMDRVGGHQPLWWVGPNYHAMHHLFPNNFFSSFANIFDLIVGTTCQFKDRRFLVTGANGAFGKAIIKKLEKRGAIVETAKFGVDYAAGDYERMREKLERAEVLVLAHGAKTKDCWNANYTTFADLSELFIDIGRNRLKPPEVWALGSEAEFHGDFGMEELKDYAASKRAFATRAVSYYRSNDVIYRHIVPSAFTSAMGKGLISADTAASIALFFIKRGFRYIPVTYTTLAFWNYFRFRRQDGHATHVLQPSGVELDP